MDSKTALFIGSGTRGWRTPIIKSQRSSELDIGTGTIFRAEDWWRFWHFRIWNSWNVGGVGIDTVGEGREDTIRSDTFDTSNTTDTSNITDTYYTSGTSGTSGTSNTSITSDTLDIRTSQVWGDFGIGGKWVGSGWDRPLNKTNSLPARRTQKWWRAE